MNELYGLSTISRVAATMILFGTTAVAGGCGADDMEVARGSSRSDVTVIAGGGTTPTAAVHPLTGEAYVAWIQSDENGLYNVFLASAKPGASTFSAPTRVNDIPGDAAPHEQAPPQVAIGPEGEIYVVWQNNTIVEGRRFPASDLRLAVSTDGGATFSPAITVNDDAGERPTSHTFHNIAVAPDGSVVVSWIDSRVQDALDAEAAEEGREAVTTVGQEIRVARSTDRGATFSPSVVVDSPSCPCCRTAVAVGPDGSTYVAWRKLFPGDVRDIVVARAAPGSLEFAEPVRVHADEWVFPGCPHAGPALEVDPGGRLHVAWYTGKDGGQGLWYAVSSDGGTTFTAPVPLVSGDFVPPSLVALATLGDGQVVAVWEDRTDEAGEVALGFFGRDEAQGVPRSESVGTGRHPALDAAGDNGLMVWLEGDAIRGRWLKPSLPEIF